MFPETLLRISENHKSLFSRSGKCGTVVDIAPGERRDLRGSILERHRIRQIIRVPQRLQRAVIYIDRPYIFTFQFCLHLLRQRISFFCRRHSLRRLLRSCPWPSVRRMSDCIKDQKAYVEYQEEKNTKEQDQDKSPDQFGNAFHNPSFPFLDRSYFYDCTLSYQEAQYHAMISLYPSPLTVTRETGFDGFVSIFSLMRRM